MAVDLKQALYILEDGEHHDVAYISANENLKKGGRIIRIENVRVKQKGTFVATTTHTTKTQNHRRNATRNLILENNTIRKMHIHTLFALDGELVQ